MYFLIFQKEKRLEGGEGGGAERGKGQGKGEVSKKWSAENIPSFMFHIPSAAKVSSSPLRCFEARAVWNPKIKDFNLFLIGI